MTNTRSLRVSIAGLMALVLVAALLARWPDLSYLAIPLIVFLVASRIGWVANARGCLAVLLCALYLPCVFGLFFDCDHCREVWLRLFPIVPTIAPSLLVVHRLGFGRLPDQVEMSLSATVLCGLVMILTWIGRRGRGWLIGSAIFAVAWSCFWAWLFSVLLRS